MKLSKKINRFDAIKSILKNTIVTTCVLLISITTISGSINANARQQEILNQELFNNPQAILNVTFKDNTYLDNIIDNELNSDKNWQGLKFDNNYGITSLSGLSNIGGVDEMVTINGQYSNRSVKRAYKNKLQELIIKIDDIKNNKSFQGEAGAKATEGVSTNIDSELAKMNGWEVKRQRYYNWSQSKILNISLVGNSDTLNTIRSILMLSGHTKLIEFTIVTELQSKIKEVQENIDIKLKSNNLPIQSELKNTELNEEDKNKIISIINTSSQDLINSELSKTEEGKKQLEQTKANQELINSGKVNLDDKDYQAIDKLVSTNNEGEKIIDSKLITELDLNYTKQEVTVIKEQLKNYNDMPNYVKKNIQSKIEQIETIGGIKESSLTKTEKFVSGLVTGVKSEAGGCKKEARVTHNSWHSQTWYVNSCFVNELGVWLTIGGIALGLAAVLGCSVVCGTLAGFIGVWYSIIQAIDKKCGDQGVYLRVRYFVPLVSKIC
jgi:hypothetical protein